MFMKGELTVTMKKKIMDVRRGKCEYLHYSNNIEWVGTERQYGMKIA
jgi:hypothetical protein